MPTPVNTGIVKLGFIMKYVEKILKSDHMLLFYLKLKAEVAVFFYNYLTDYKLFLKLLTCTTVTGLSIVTASIFAVTIDRL